MQVIKEVDVTRYSLKFLRIAQTCIFTSQRVQMEGVHVYYPVSYRVEGHIHVHKLACPWPWPLSSTEPWTTIFVAEWAFSCAYIQATNMTIALNTLLFLLQSLSDYTKMGCENSLQLCICLSICKSRRRINHGHLNMHDLVPLHAPGITLASLSKWTHCSQV